jgi:hypothetical protein
MSWKRFNEQIDRGPVIAISVVWKISVFVLILFGITTCTVVVVNKPFSVVGGTLDNDNVKYNYEWFKTRHESILSLEVQIDQAQDQVIELKAELGPRDKWHREDRAEYARLRAVVLGLEAARAQQAADYNARSKMINRSIFKGTDTPVSFALEKEAK